MIYTLYCLLSVKISRILVSLLLLFVQFNRCLAQGGLNDFANKKERKRKTRRGSEARLNGLELNLLRLSVIQSLNRLNSKVQLVKRDKKARKAISTG